MPFIHVEGIDERQMLPGFYARMLHAENMTVSRWRIEAGAVLPEHSHPHEQVTVMLEGTFEMTVNGEKQVIKPGDLVVIPSQATHSARAITDCLILDVFSPVREDYR